MQTKQTTIAKKTFRVNDQIRVPKVRLIDEKGKQVGVIETSRALKKAEDAELDLIEVSPKADPPVAKIMDYGQYKYQLKKQEQAQRKKQKKVEVKGIRLSIRISENDLKMKVNRADRFLKEGNRVMIDLMMRGREQAHEGLAREQLEKFREQIKTPNKVEEGPEKVGNRLQLLISPEK